MPVKKIVGDTTYEFNNVEELIDFESQLANIKQEEKPLYVRVPKEHGEKYNYLTKEQCIQIKNLVETECIFFRKAFSRIITNRAIGGKDYLSYEEQMGEKYPRPYRRNIVEQTPKIQKYAKQHKRMKAIQDIIKKLINVYKYDYEKARMMAIQIYDKGTVLPVYIQEQEKGFPNVYVIKNLEELETLCKHTIANKTKITYFDVKDLLGLKDNLHWNGIFWREFCYSLIQKSKQITDYFGAKGKFIMVTENSYDVIKYE